MPAAARLTRDAIITVLRAAGCVFAEDEADLLIAEADSATHLEDMVSKRITGLPLEHIVGWAEFAGLRIVVEPGVFVPRRRTEFLLHEAIAIARRMQASGENTPVAVDLCCGSGAVGAALLEAVPSADLYAADIDPAAVHCARRNIAPDRVFEGDLFDALPQQLRGTIQILAANTPYVPTDAIGMMPPEARLYEAPVALDGGADGLDLQRRIATDASEWLTPGGYLLVETSVDQAPISAAIFEASGLRAAIMSNEEADATIVIAHKPATPPANGGPATSAQTR